MIKKLLLTIILAAPVALFAQEKIAYVNSQEIISKMPETKDMQTKMQAKQSVVRTTAEAIEAEYKAKIEQFQNDSTTPTQSIVADRQKQIQDLEDRYKTYLETSQAELEKEYESLTTPIQQKFMKALKEVGDAQNYLFIIDAASVVYVNPGATNANKLVETKLGITE